MFELIERRVLIRIGRVAELHFKLATRRSSGSSEVPVKSEAERSRAGFELEAGASQDRVRFDKILKTLGRKDSNLDQRLDELKQMYELNRYDELLTRLKDAESKNEYLASVIAQLQSRRGLDTGAR